MSTIPSLSSTSLDRPGRGHLLVLLWRDKPATIAAVFLLLLFCCAVFGPLLVGDAAYRVNLHDRNTPPFLLDGNWLYFLGGDTLGRSIIARIVAGSQGTLVVATSATVAALMIGSALGLVAGFRGGRISNLIMRAADVVMSFPSLLLALVVLYVLGTSVANVILVLAITRIPLYLRTARAEVLEIRERMFVTAARVLGASRTRIIWRHIAPMTVPTLVTLATLDFALVMLSESSLSFLGLGIQPPSISWGSMVAEGQNYLSVAWWISFWPGLAIALTTVAVNLVSEWLRIINDPTQRWRLEARRRG